MPPAHQPHLIAGPGRQARPVRAATTERATAEGRCASAGGEGSLETDCTAPLPSDDADDHQQRTEKQAIPRAICGNSRPERCCKSGHPGQPQDFSCDRVCAAPLS
jgi:hypothetical protein